jgi:hypothetical protein
MKSFVVGSAAIAALVASTLFMGAAGISTQAAAQERIGQGAFKGESRHVASGTVSVFKSSSGTVVTLEKDFSFDGAPDPKFGFGRNGYDPKAKFSELKSNKGKQVYEIPSSIDASKYNEVWIWCQQYNVPLGVAAIKK